MAAGCSAGGRPPCSRSRMRFPGCSCSSRRRPCTVVPRWRWTRGWSGRCATGPQPGGSPRRRGLWVNWDHGEGWVVVVATKVAVVGLTRNNDVTKTFSVETCAAVLVNTVAAIVVAQVAIVVAKIAAAAVIVVATVVEKSCCKRTVASACYSKCCCCCKFGLSPL